MTKYFCDRCGDEVEKLSQLSSLYLERAPADGAQHRWVMHVPESKHSELVCSQCIEKTINKIKEIK